MSHSDLVDEIDRRGATAAAELRRELDEYPIPELRSTGEAAGARWRSGTMLVAAALVVVALVAAGLLLAESNEESTIAAQPDAPARGPVPVGLVDPAGAGFELRGAFDGDTGAANTVADFGVDRPATVQGPADAERPWTKAVVAVTRPFEAPLWRGQLVDIGGIDAIVSADFHAPTVQWRDGDAIHQLSSTHLDRDALVSLAADAVAAGYDDGDALPGQQILYVGHEYDLFPFFPAGSVRSPDQLGLVYDGTDLPDFAVTVTTGGSARWRASFARAVDVTDTTIAGQPAVIATFGRYDNTTHVFWTRTDGTVVAVHTDGDVGDLLPVLDQLRPLSRTEFAQALRDRPLPDDPPFRYRPPPTAGPSLATASTSDAGRTYEASLHPAGDEFLLAASISHDRGTSSGELAVNDLTVNAISRIASRNPDTSDGAGAAGGIVDRDIADMVVTDAATGDVIPTPVTATSPVDGTDSMLFVIALDGLPFERTLDLSIRATDGSEIRFRF